MALGTASDGAAVGEGLEDTGTTVAAELITGTTTAAELITAEDMGTIAAELLAVGMVLLTGGADGAGLLIAEDIGTTEALALADTELHTSDGTGAGAPLLMRLGVAIGNGAAELVGLGFVAPGIGTRVKLLHL